MLLYGPEDGQGAGEGDTDPVLDDDADEQEGSNKP
jgi:hypothetical protein